MSARILWLNPVMTSTYDQPIAEALQSEARPGTRVDVASLAGTGPKHLEYHAYEMIAAAGTIGAIRWAERAGYDAAIDRNVSTTSLFEERARSRRGRACHSPRRGMPQIVSTLGVRVSIIVGRDKRIPEDARERFSGMEFADWLASSSRKLGMSVDELQRDPGVTDARTVEQAQRAAEDDGDDVSFSAARSSSASTAKSSKTSASRSSTRPGSSAPRETPSPWPTDGDRHGWSHSNAAATTSEIAERREWVPIVEPIVATVLGPIPKRRIEVDSSRPRPR